MHVSFISVIEVLVTVVVHVSLTSVTGVLATQWLVSACVFHLCDRGVGDTVVS